MFFSAHSSTILVVPGSSQKREHECAGDGWEVWLKLTSVCMWFERIHISFISEPRTELFGSVRKMHSEVEPKIGTETPHHLSC